MRLVFFFSDTECHFDLDQIHKQIKSVQRGISRLIDAYQEGLLEKVDFEPRMARARERLSRLQLEAKSAQDRDAQRKEVRLVLGQLEDFAEQVRIGLDQADFSKRREVIRCLVKMIKVEEKQVRITYRITPRPFVNAPSGGSFRQLCHYHVRRHIAQYQRPGQGVGVPQVGAGEVRGEESPKSSVVIA